MFRQWPFSPSMNVWPWAEYEEFEPSFQQLAHGPSTMGGDMELSTRGGPMLGTRNWTSNAAGLIKTERKKTGELVIRAQLPGVNRDDVRLDLKEEDDESILTLSAEKKEEHTQREAGGGLFQRSSFFKVHRSIPLGTKVNVDDVKADLIDDQLIVEVKLPPLPTSDEKPSSRIDIHSSTSRKDVGDNVSKSAQHQTQSKAGKGDSMDTDINKESGV